MIETVGSSMATRSTSAHMGHVTIMVHVPPLDGVTRVDPQRQ